MRRRTYSYSQYLDIVSGSRVRYEFVDGVVRALPEGDAVLERLVRRLEQAVCGASRSVRLRIGAVSTYADLAVVVGAPVAPPDDDEAVVNPTVLVEVVAPETEAEDRGVRFARFRSLASVGDVLLVTPARVEHYRREGEGWRFRDLITGTLELLPGDRVDVGALLAT